VRTSVLFVTPKWGDGGGERTWLNILARLDRERFRPSLAYFEKVDSHFLREIPDDVPVHDLRKRRRLSRDLPRAVRALRAVLREERPDVAVSLLHTWGFLLDAARLGLGLRMPIIANEHIHVDSSLAYLSGQRPVLSRAAPLLHRLAYARATRVVGVSERQMDDLLAGAGKTVSDMTEVAEGNFPDPTDRALLESNRNFTLRLRDRERKLLAKIKEAMKRIDDGAFGTCDRCGGEIGEKRLTVRPVTTMCIDCKTDAEEEEAR